MEVRMQLKQMNITDMNVLYRKEQVCISILIQKDVQESTEKVRMLGILKIWKNNDTFRRPCHNRHGCALHQMQKVYLLPEMAAIIKPLRQIFISAAHMEKG